MREEKLFPEFETEGRSGEAGSRRGLGRRIAAFGAKGLVAAGMIGLVVLGVGLLHMRAATRAEPEAAPPLPVAVAPAVRQEGFVTERAYVGRLEARRGSLLSFELGGLLTRVFVDEGDAVQAGQVLARLDTKALAARRDELEAQLQSVQARLELARLTTDRQRQLSDQGHSSQQRYDEARLEAEALRAEEQSLRASIRRLDIDIEKSSLRAPFAGRIAQRMHDEGAVLAAGAPLMEVLETAALQARIGISPDAARSLRGEQDYRLNYGEETLTARLVALRPDLTRDTRTMTALFALPQSEALPIGELVSLSLPERVVQSGSWVPLEALVDGTKGLWTVYVIDRGDAERPRIAQEAVVVHHVDGERAYVSGSLAAGEEVIVMGAHRVAPGQLVDPRPADSNPGSEEGPSVQISLSGERS